MSSDTEARLSAALEEIFGCWPYVIDIDHVEERGRWLRVRWWAKWARSERAPARGPRG